MRVAIGGWWVVLATTAAMLAAAEGPQTPLAELESFQLLPGLRIELVAAEPLVESPVAMAFDERGGLYVAENRGYPNGPPEGQPGLGRIARLIDLDGDGDFDQRVTFADNLSFPNGLLPWEGGLIVTCAPDILFLRDRDGDGVAEEREVWFTGFSTAGSTQLRVSHPTLGPDGWIYVTSGLTGGAVTNPAAPEVPAVKLGRTDFRFRPDRSAWEGASGGAQFGQTFDPYGRRFICYNRVQVQHVVLTEAILARQPALSATQMVHNCPADVVAEPTRGHGAAARLFPLSSNVTTADSHAGTFTAACSVTWFLGDQLPEVFRGAIFSCDPTGNLVHADRLTSAGATFDARGIAPDREFLASPDNWFRPVFLATGPDGALYVCDMYRKTIEHPDYLPVELRKHTDFDSGRHLGRIWRVVSQATPAETLAELRKVDLGRLSATELVGRLDNANGWVRETARRLLLRGEQPREDLRQLAQDGVARPEAIAAAAQLLAGGQTLDDARLDFLAGHPEPALRELALGLADNGLALTPARVERGLKLAHDADPRVRFQAALELGGWPATTLRAEPRVADDTSRRVAEALAALGRRGGGDRWTQTAVLAGTRGRERGVAEALQRDLVRGAETAPGFVVEMARVTATALEPRETAVLAANLIAHPLPQWEQHFLWLNGLARAMRRRPDFSAEKGVLASLLALGGGDFTEALDRLRHTAEEHSTNHDLSAEQRLVAVEMLGACAGPGVGPDVGVTLLGLVDAREPVEIQRGAVKALTELRHPELARELLDARRVSAVSPAVRDEILSGVLTDIRGATVLLEELEQDRLPRILVDAYRRRMLTQHADPGVKSRAEALFGTVTGDRAKVYAEYRDVVELASNSTRGREVFRRVCAGCHRLEREGYQVGPDLFSIRNQPKSAILLHILVPDQEITEGFTAQTVLTRDGRTLSGLVASETATSLTLRMQQGKEESLSRDEIEELAPSTTSLMPQGLEKDLSRQDLADLLAFLKGERGE